MALMEEGHDGIAAIAALEAGHQLVEFLHFQASQVGVPGLSGIPKRVPGCTDKPYPKCCFPASLQHALLKRVKKAGIFSFYILASADSARPCSRRHPGT